MFEMVLSPLHAPGGLVRIPLATLDLEMGVMAVLLTVQIGLLLLFSWLARGPWRHLSLRGGRSARRTGRFFQQLQAIVARTHTEVGRHHVRVEAAKQSLIDLRAGGQTPSPEKLLELLEVCVTANDEMRHELAASQRRLEEQARRIEQHINEARTDVLTGLPNRRALDDELRERLERPEPSRPMCLVLFDADGFKAINDQHGHLAGDAVLQQIAERISRQTRAVDFVARYGGEEFAVVFPSIASGDAAEAAERVRLAVSELPAHYQGQDITVTLSAGAATQMPRDTPTSLLRRADAALYASKRGGRNCLHFNHQGELRRYASQPRPAPAPWDGVERRRGAASARAEGAPEPSRVDEREIRQLCSDLVDRLAEATRGGGGHPSAPLAEKSSG